MSTLLRIAYRQVRLALISVLSVRAVPAFAAIELWLRRSDCALGFVNSHRVSVAFVIPPKVRDTWLSVNHLRYPKRGVTCAILTAS